ncbi:MULTISPECIES: DUF5811 family protein [unclassified Haladaptatus]|uniref:DUF5811 family protein n=1 Tax=unclassified Haladaptatus TaxID=2622732 RepID=UPI0007B499A7|nr:MULTISPECIES: DUF5811 family protein [unclassified Haladaptatus]KZN25398.1 hypothetical protein A4G99_02560 [Haladaptatus sp. R4]MCO8242923.1 DUF5811 family protein [Haladaptatus sp. AB643]MCO8252680.1 DUF5811 family protein [Haladaptatus sp. AB618]
MNGNTPYAGIPDVTQAGQRASVDVEELTPKQRRLLRDSVSDIATLTRKYLPEEYIIGSQVTNSMTGPQASVSVQPPVGHIVSAGFEPERDELDDEELIGEEERDEVARGLAASAALQVKQAIEDQVTPTAR